MTKRSGSVLRRLLALWPHGGEGEHGLSAADSARARKDWRTAVMAYDAYLKRRPRDVAAWVKLGKTCFAAGELELAEAAFRRAVALRPRRASLQRALAEVLTAARGNADIAGGMDRALGAYQLFREQLETPRPPTTEAVCINILIDAGDAYPAAVRNMLVALTMSEHKDWRVWVVGADLTDHPLASLAHVDDRIRFAVDARIAPDDGVWLSIDAGVAVHPLAMGWLLHATLEGDVVAAYADHDHAEVGPGGYAYSSPVFQASPDLEEMRSSPQPPTIALFRYRPAFGKSVHQQLMEAFGQGAVLHVPLLLSTRLVFPGVSRPVETPQKPERRKNIPGKVLVVIPTRDEPVMLKLMVESLIQKASRPKDLRLLVIDNRSRLEETQALLSSLRKDDRIVIRPVDEPFNWSRLNNLAVEGRDEPFLVFANNDMEMLTVGWDDQLRDALTRAGNAAAGARLLYPEGRIQHAGIALRGGGAEPAHEGLGEDADAEGPLGRWRRSRPVAAVTGAFLAVRRDVFDAVGGFDAVHHIVACNDIDFCLKVREAGWRVLYLGELTLTHFESMTRGHADSPEKQAWAAAEMSSLAERWGDDSVVDPGRNPHWKTQGKQLFGALRSPSQAEVEAYLNRGRQETWRVRRRSVGEKRPDLGV